MTSRPRMTVRHQGDSLTLVLGDEPKSCVLGRYRITVEPVDTTPDDVQGSGDPFEAVTWKK